MRLWAGDGDDAIWLYFWMYSNHSQQLSLTRDFTKDFKPTLDFFSDSFKAIGTNIYIYIYFSDCSTL